MKHLKSYKIFESVLSKSELVDKIKYLSNFLHNYMKDVNKYTSSNLNFGFSYNTELDIREIFDTADKLQHDSPDGFITAICNEFITWSQYIITDNTRKYDDVIRRGFIHELLPNSNILFFSDYDNYTDENKALWRQNRDVLLYSQEVTEKIYVYVGQKIKQLISGTIWDIPNDKKTLTDKDKDFIMDCLRSDYDIEIDNIDHTFYHSKRGLIIKINQLTNINSRMTRLIKDKLSYDSDFINRIQSYFNGALILNNGYSDYQKLYLPFYI